MKMLKKILLPTDFSGSSQGAIDMAITLARMIDAEITLLHVLQVFTNSKALLNELTKNVRYQLTTVQEYMRKKGVQTGEPVVLIGSNFEHIVKLSEKLKVDLILMGSGEKGLHDSFKLGVTAAKVIKNASLPVWVVKNQTQASVQKIVCPVDFSWPSERALNNAIKIAEIFNAKLHVLNVVEPMTETFLGMGNLLESEQQLLADNQQIQFDKFLERFDFSGIKYSKEMAHGRAYQEILNRITSHANRLLVMGTTGLSKHPNVLMGSVTEKVVLQVPCSFITLQTSDGEN